MKRSLIICGVLAVALFPASVSGRQASSNQANSVKDPAGTEMRRLVDRFVGTWSIHEISEADATGKKTDDKYGEEVWHALAGGVPLVEEYHIKTATGDEYDTATLWWDAVTSKYRGTWCADFNLPGCSNFDVRWEGDQITMEGEFTPGAATLAWRETFVFTGHDAFTQTLYIGKPGSDLKKASTIHGARVK